MKDPEYAYVKKKPDREPILRPPVRFIYVYNIIFSSFLKVTPPRTPQPPKVPVCYV
jgi:hypothetical protein